MGHNLWIPLTNIWRCPLVQSHFVLKINSNKNIFERIVTANPRYFSDLSNLLQDFIEFRLTVSCWSNKFKWQNILAKLFNWNEITGSDWFIVCISLFSIDWSLMTVWHRQFFVFREKTNFFSSCLQRQRNV